MREEGMDVEMKGWRRGSRDEERSQAYEHQLVAVKTLFTYSDWTEPPVVPEKRKGTDERDSKGQPTQSGSRLYPSHDIQLESVSKTASKAETIEEEDNKKTGGEQRLCESESVRERKCEVDRDAESVCRCDHPGVQNRLTPTLTFLCIIWKSRGMTVWMHAHP
ncbi:hypothetical protein GBF38_011442 [Nibea albiflora]|uniref:Uncharacterized protein n=1 Tax=Nibea albiflora TaxID=240163 RepID=A0ACB7F4D3_NIBAL|nr:hypothetical protein GBF38_011442 [Nibea albiflora]